MSGGSMDYLYSRIEDCAVFALNTLERKAFSLHLAHVIKALHDIEWVDSGDSAPGSESAAIYECLVDGVRPLLADPAAVHVMMLRGSIARPTWRHMVDLLGEVPNGEDVQLSRIAQLQEELAQALDMTRELTKTIERSASRRDGNFLDKLGACKVCDGEIPYGHTDYCDIWKLEKELTQAKGLIRELGEGLTKLGKEPWRVGEFEMLHTSVQHYLKINP